MDKIIEIIASYLKDESKTYVVSLNEYKLLDFHSLGHMIYPYLDKENSPKEVVELSKKAYFKAYKLDQVQHKAFLDLINVCEEKGYDCLPLKGTVMKSLYRDSFIRSMGDMDILFKEKDINEVVDLLISKGFESEGECEHHIGVFKGPILFEIHRKVVPYIESYDVDIINDTFSKAKLKEGYNHIYEMTKEDYFIFHIIHLNKHLKAGGTGFRSFLDIYIYLDKYQNLDMEYINSELSKVDLACPLDLIIRFSKDLFDLKKLDEEEKELYNTVLTSGVYGTLEGAAKNEIKRSGGSKFKASLRKIFPPSKHMKSAFPILQKHGYLLPFFYIYRILRALFTRPISAFRTIIFIAKSKK
ncbi:MAG: nucleotidyltransferase family protein [Bacilli bacterium]|nr:nucleotidyltransferase family protein [Bacilli bacterium]